MLVSPKEIDVSERMQGKPEVKMERCFQQSSEGVIKYPNNQIEYGIEFPTNTNEDIDCDEPSNVTVENSPITHCKCIIL